MDYPVSLREQQSALAVQGRSPLPKQIVARRILMPPSGSLSADPISHDTAQCQPTRREMPFQRLMTSSVLETGQGITADRTLNLRFDHRITAHPSDRLAFAYLVQ